MVGSGVVGVWALAWLTRIPPLPDCEEITRFSSYNDRLICAQTQMQSASARDLVQAVELTADWGESHPLYEEARPVLLEASQRLLKRATEEMHAGNLSGAIDLAQKIPLNTPLRDAAQAAIWDWQKDWDAGKQVESTVRQAIDGRNWPQAIDTLQQLKGLTSDYWLSQRYTDLQRTIDREQTAWTQLEQARALAATGNPDNLGQALVLAQQVSLNSDAWAEAKQDLDRWSQNLLLYSFQRWEVGDLDGAIAAVQKVPPDPKLAPEARDLIQFSHGIRLAEKAQDSPPSYLQLFRLMEAIRAVDHIEPGSPFYEQAQTSLQEWRAQLSDLQKLQFAYAVAGLRQPWAYRYAMDVAWRIDLQRPRRLQAQTLIAHWVSEIERIEDRPFLLRAERLAQRASIPALQAAIAEAQQISLGRALRLEAQTRIAAWRNQIEVIQDQPILNEANALASDGKLKEAIEVAQRIEADRALYDQAQVMVQDWTHTLQIREDGPILARARDRAYGGYLSEAIAIASQIGPGRALYSEAQRDITLWVAERNYIWSLQDSAEDSTSEGEGSDRDTPSTAESSDNVGERRSDPVP